MTAPIPSPAGACRDGFTLVELLVVVMLLGILAGVAAPQYADAIAGIEFEAVTKQLAADLRSTRHQAVRRGRTTGLAFDPPTATYRSADGVDPVFDPRQPGRELATRVDSQPGLRIVSADFDGSQQVTFDFRGEPSSSGRVTLECGAKTHTVRVDELGGVTVE